MGRNSYPKCAYKITCHGSGPGPTMTIDKLQQDIAGLFDRRDDSQHEAIPTDYTQTEAAIKAVFSDADAQLANLARSKASEGWVCFATKANFAPDGSWTVRRPLAFGAGVEESLSGEIADRLTTLPITLHACLESEWNPLRGTLRVATINGTKYAFTAPDGTTVVTRPVLEVWSQDLSKSALGSGTRILASYTYKSDLIRNPHKPDLLRNQDTQVIEKIFGLDNDSTSYQACSEDIASAASRGDVLAGYEALEKRSAGSFFASQTILAQRGWTARMYH